MKARRYFLLTSISGMVGMLSLIATSLFKSWTSNASVSDLSDEAIDHLHFLATATFTSLIISQIAVAAFVIFLILYLVSKNQRTHSR